LNNPKYNSLNLGPIALSFTIENGRIEVEPFDFKMGKYKIEASGSSGIDQSLDFDLDMNIPASDVKASGLLSQLGSAINTIPLKVKIGGTLTNPEVRPSFGDIGSQLLNSLKSTLSNKVDVVKADAKKAANKKLEDLVKAAEEQGDKLIAEAEAQAEKLNIEAAKQAQNLRNEGDKLAQKIIAEAGSNPIKQVAAKPLSAKAKSEADEKAALLERKAQEQGDNLIQVAKKKKEKLIQDARAKAQV
jgi:vacuolar-type H+-ATPase subunit H